MTDRIKAATDDLELISSAHHAPGCTGYRQPYAAKPEQCEECGGYISMTLGCAIRRFVRRAEVAELVRLVRTFANSRAQVEGEMAELDTEHPDWEKEFDHLVKVGKTFDARGDEHLNRLAALALENA